MFANTIVFDKPLEAWDVSMVTNMTSMFANAVAFNQPLNGWGTDVGNVTSMNSMFSNCPFNQNIASWDVSSVTDFNSMFGGNTTFNQDISGWTINTTGAIDMRSMFSGASSFNQDLGLWDVSHLYKAYNMLNNSGLSIENYDNLLIAWSSLTFVYSGFNFGAQGLYYCSAQAERDILTNAPNNWFITDAGQGCIAIYEGADTSGPEITNGQIIAYDFGSAQAGVGKTKSITIENRLSTTVTVDVAITGTAFSVTSPSLPVTIAIAPGTQTIDIFFNESVAGTYPEDISITSADFPGSFDFRLLGVITDNPEPEIKVFEGTGTSGLSFADGDDSGYYVGEDVRGNDLITQFTIFNDGSASLDITDINFSGIGAFSASPTSFSVAIGGFETIDVTLDASVSGYSSQTMNIVNNDADEDPFDFVIEGDIKGPELIVIDGTNFYSDPHISNGQPDPFYLGTSTVGSNLVKQITLTNNGPVDLEVTNISILGTSFTHNASLPITIPAEVDGTYTYVSFEITLDGTTAGRFTETVNITSDDDTDPIYVFDVSGDISDPNDPKIYWTDYDEINRSNLDGTAFQAYHTEPTYDTRGIAIDTLNNVVYWTNEWGQIRKGTMGATGFTGVSDFINDGVDIAREMNGIALDVPNGKVYWASTYDGTIKSADLFDPDPITTVQTIVSGLAYPIGIAVDSGNKLYYTDNDDVGGSIDNTATLHQVNIDGSSDIILKDTTVTGEDYTYRDIKLDIDNNMIYWSGGNSDAYFAFGKISYADLSDVVGTVASFTTTFRPYGFDLDLYNDKIYWSDDLIYYSYPLISRANLDGSSQEVLFDGAEYQINSPWFIAVDPAPPSASCPNPPTADAGTDQTICESDVASLSGTIGGDANLLTWSTGGDGTFDDATSSTAVYTPGTNDITNGAVTLTLTTDDPDGTGPCTAASDDVIISFETLPTADAGADQAICESDAAYLGATIGGSATSLTWSTNGDGAFDDNTSLTASYVPGAADITSGTVTLTLTTGGSATCTPITDDLVITIVQAHTVDAGPDQVICTTDVATMNGSFGGSATSASWATSGNGSFDDATSLTAVYTPGPADISSGSVTLYLSTSSNTCPIVTDDMIISFSQPITAIDQAGGSVRVGETITIDALNGATLNTGDVITTSVTVDPQKGTVSVNSNGTIDYTTSNGFIGSDSFDFQICNQCNLCSTATATVTIENDAPSFTGTTATASPGAPVTIDIISLITDVNNNVDLSSISIVEQPISGALATLDGNSNLIVDYTGVIFFGTDEVVIEVCDFDGACSTATIFIEVAPQEITAYNAVSPNNDGRHDFLEFQYIEGYPDNIVRVFNRWGDIVFEEEGYNNQDKVFDGKANKGASGDLPTGTYFYTVIYQTTDNQSKTVKGFFELRR